MNILCIDLGFGDAKVAYGTKSKGVDKLYKFPTVFAEVQVSKMVSDTRAINFGEKSYYVGPDALSLQSSSIIDVMDYAHLEFAAPLFVGKVLKDLNSTPDVLVVGLSISHIENSGHFKSRIKDYLKDAGIRIPIELVPQGMVSKLAIEKYGTEFPDSPQDFSKTQNYVGCDIGFNTLDIFQVINGVASTNLVKGIPERGIQVIVSRLLPVIEEKTKKSLSMSEGKQVLDEGKLQIRGEVIYFNEEIDTLKRQYVDELKIIVENEFGEVLDKMDSLILFGGGSHILSSEEDGFTKYCGKYSEFYNVISYFLHGASKSV